MTPDEHGDWINQRNESFETFLAIGHKKSHGKKLFETFSLSISTNHDAWAYHSSREHLVKNMNHND